ncbi:Neprilysin-2 [Orchesella cincta]|uniref:Neprilysin-2 n=1 Tax=Orchesella cincta TaxID=48709 RepID=A0A1D2MXA2_ORCCI|nr:Neprilysin-2 [Orchesella cincta]
MELQQFSFVSNQTLSQYLLTPPRTENPTPITKDRKNDTEKIEDSQFKNLSSSQNKDSLSENSILTDFQRIKLKDIRKFARLAGHEHPEVITDIDSKICYKDDCLEAAKEFFISMDFAQEPCDDWKKFACEWRTLSTKTAFDQQTTLSLLVENQVKEILTTYNTDKDALTNAKSYYGTCLAWHQDFNRIDHTTAYLETFGNWPLLTGKKETPGNWTKLLVEILKIVSENVTPYILKVEPVAINEESLTLLKIDSGFTNLDVDVEDIKLLLEILRKKQSSSSEEVIEQISSMKNCMKSLTRVEFDAIQSPEVLSLKELQSKLAKSIPDSQLNMVNLFQEIFEGTDVKITPEMKMLTTVDSLIEYIKAVESCKTSAHGKLQKTKFEVLNNNIDTEETIEVFSHAISEEYITRYFKNSQIDVLNDLAENLKKGFTEVIRSISWLEVGAKDLIYDKISNAEILAGYPSWLLNEEAVEKYYKNIKFPVTGNSNQSQVYLVYRSTLLSRLNGKLTKMKLDNDLVDGWNYDIKAGFVGDTSVEYIPSLNQLRIPAGIIQVPFFSPDFPGYMNYGGLGSVVARELARLFDSDGIFTNADGETGLWLDEKSYKNYIDWTMRLQKDWGMNEISPKDKIASILGYHITVKGYEEHLKALKKEGKSEVKLPGLSEIPPEKLLQLKYTNVLCENYLIRRMVMKEDPNNYHHNFDSFALAPVTRNNKFLKLFECQHDIFNQSFDFM